MLAQLEKIPNKLLHVCWPPIAFLQSSFCKKTYTTIGKELVSNAGTLTLPALAKKHLPATLGELNSEAAVQRLWNSLVAEALEDKENVQAFDMSTRPMDDGHKPDMLIIDTTKSSQPSFRNAITVIELKHLLRPKSPSMYEAVGQVFHRYLAIQAAQECRTTLGFIVGDGAYFYVGQLYAFEEEVALQHNRPYRLNLSNRYSIDQGTSHYCCCCWALRLS